jgi:hypothetical protein
MSTRFRVSLLLTTTERERERECVGWLVDNVLFDTTE